MNISPGLIGIGAGIVAGAGIGLSVTKATNSFADRHPTGPQADENAPKMLIGGGTVSAVLASAGSLTMATGRVHLGAGLLGAGIGGVIGTAAAAVLLARQHGSDGGTTVAPSLQIAEHNRSGQLELSQTKFQQPESIRTLTGAV